MKWGGNPEASLWSFFTDVRSDLSSAIFLSQHNVQCETRNRSEACNAVPWHRLVVGGSWPWAWLPRPSCAPSQLACRDRLKVTAPPLRLSGMSPESRSGDAKEAWVRCEAAFATQLSDNRMHSFRLPVAELLTMTPESAVGQEQRFRAVLAVVWDAMRTSAAFDANGRCTPYGTGTLIACV